MTMKGDKIAI